MSCLVCARLQDKKLCSMAKALIVKLINSFFAYFAVTKHTSLLWCQVGRSAVPLWTQRIHKEKVFPVWCGRSWLACKTILHYRDELEHGLWVRPDYQHQFVGHHWCSSVWAGAGSTSGGKCDSREWRLFEQHNNEHGFGQTCSAITYGHNVLVFPFLWRRSVPPLTLDQFPPPTVLSIFLALLLGIFI